MANRQEGATKEVSTQKNEVNKAFYRKAEQLQRQTHLPDGVAADEYGRNALAFLIHISD